MRNVCLGDSLRAHPPRRGFTNGALCGRSPLGNPPRTAGARRWRGGYFQPESIVLSVGRLSETSLTTAIDQSPRFIFVISVTQTAAGIASLRSITST